MPQFSSKLYFVHIGLSFCLGTVKTCQKNTTFIVLEFRSIHLSSANHKNLTYTCQQNLLLLKHNFNYTTDSIFCGVPDVINPCRMLGEHEKNSFITSRGQVFYKHFQFWKTSIHPTERFLGLHCCPPPHYPPGSPSLPPCVQSFPCKVDIRSPESFPRRSL